MSANALVRLLLPEDRFAARNTALDGAGRAGTFVLSIGGLGGGRIVEGGGSGGC